MKLETPADGPGFWIVVLVLMALLSVSGCQEDTPTSCPSYAVGTVQGYLLSVGQGVSMDIRARSVEGSNWGEIVASTTSDSRGWYRFDTPSGLYRLEVKPDDEHSFSYDPRDTVRVRKKVRRYDLWKCRIEVQVGVPDEMEGQVFRFRLVGNSLVNSSVEATVQSGNLEFVFPVVSSGTFKMKMKSPRSEYFYLPGTYESSQAYSLIVGTEEVARYEIDFSNTFASVSGVVTGSWQQTELGRMGVKVLSTAGDREISREECDEDGSFTCDVFVPGQVKIGTVFDYYATQWIGGDSYETAQVFDIQPGDRFTDISVVESGIAVQLEMPGDLIGVRPAFKIRDENDLEVWMNPTGNNPYYFFNFRPERYFVYVEGYCDNQIWAPQWYGDAEDFESAEPIDLVAGELREISINLVEGGRIEGEIRDSDGRVPSGARYQVYDLEGDPLCNYWKHWMGDRMLFSGLPDGTYLVAARDLGNEPWYYPGTIDFSEATQIVIENHQTVAGLVWALPVAAKEGSP